MKKTSQRFVFLSVICVVCTLCAVLVLASSFHASFFFFTPGFSSWYIMFGVVIGEYFSASYFLVLFSKFWFLSFPLLSIVAFIFTFFHRYIPFFIVAILDASITIAWTVLRFVSYDSYFGKLFLIDAVGSCIVVIIMGILIRKSKQWNGFLAPSGEDPQS